MKSKVAKDVKEKKKNREHNLKFSFYYFLFMFIEFLKHTTHLLNGSGNIVKKENQKIIKNVNMMYLFYWKTRPNTQIKLKYRITTKTKLPQLFQYN